MARDGEAGPDVPGQPGRLGTGEVAGHPALRRAAVDGEQGHVEGERPQLLHLTLVPDAVPGVVDREATEARDVSEVPAAAALVALDLLVGGGDGRDAEAGHLDLSAVVEAHRSRRIDLQPLGGEGAVGLRHDEDQFRVGVEERAEGLGVEVVGVVVARRHHVDEVQPRRIEDALGHADVGLVGPGVLLGERVGEVRIEE